MKIELKKIKHYLGTQKSLIVIDNEPILVTNKPSQANMLIAYINGADVEIKDKKLIRLLNKFRNLSK